MIEKLKFMEKELSTEDVETRQKINEIIDWINTQNSCDNDCECSEEDKSPESTDLVSSASKGTRKGCGKDLKFKAECGDVTRMGTIQTCDDCKRKE